MKGSLIDWLEAATRGLPEGQAARLREEIESHYEEAVRNYLLAGYPPEQARRASLTDLGAPEETARRARALEEPGRPLPLPWPAILLAVLPGLYFTAAELRLLPDLSHPAAPLLGVALVGCLLGGWLLARPDRGSLATLVPALFPLVGLLGTWLSFFLLAALPYPFLFLQPFLFLLLTGTILFRKFNLRERAHRPLWLLLGLLALPFILPSRLLFALPLGLLLARRYGMMAALLLLGTQYPLVQLSDLDYGILIWTTNVQGERLLSLIPPISYLIVAPLLFTRARSDRGRLAALILPSGLALLGGEFLRSLILQETMVAYTLSLWLWSIFLILPFPAELGLAALLFRHVGEGGERKFTREGAAPGREGAAEADSYLRATVL